MRVDAKCSGSETQKYLFAFITAGKDVEKRRLKQRWGLTNPLCALNGLGCTLLSTRCFCELMPLVRCWAGIPHARKTTPLVRTRFTVSMTFCVKRSHPF